MGRAKKRREWFPCEIWVGGVMSKGKKVNYIGGKKLEDWDIFKSCSMTYSDIANKIRDLGFGEVLQLGYFKPRGDWRKLDFALTDEDVKSMLEQGMEFGFLKMYVETNIQLEEDRFRQHKNYVSDEEMEVDAIGSSSAMSSGSFANFLVHAVEGDVNSNYRAFAAEAHADAKQCKTNASEPSILDDNGDVAAEAAEQCNTSALDASKPTEFLHQRSSSATNGSSRRFFKEMLKSSLQARKMSLPRIFVRDFGHELETAANLIAPGGHIWKVGLTKSQNTIDFDKYWDGFIERYSINHGDLLVFNYKGYSSFKVRIFRKSGHEIEFPSYVTKSGEPDNEKGIGDEDFIDASCPLKHEDCDERGKNGECSKSPSMFNKSRKTRKHQKKAAPPPKITKDETRSESQDPYSDSDFRNGGRLEIGFRNAPKKSQSAILSSKKFKSRYPCFKVLLLKYNFASYFVSVPMPFARNYLRERPDSVKLKISDKIQWSVTLNHKQNGQMSFGRGWIKFSRENNLKVGDICVFELVKKYVFKVYIFHA